MAEGETLSRLRHGVRQLRHECDFSAKATAYAAGPTQR